MISFDTTPLISNQDYVVFLSDTAVKMGLDVEIQNELQHGVPQSNIIIRLNPVKPGEKTFLLQSHLDTTDPGAYSLWKKNQSNPFDAVIDEGFIYGLGAAEVKIDFLCKLFAMYNIKKKTNTNEFKTLSPILVGTFGEESGMQGALKIIRKNKLNALYALISAPSDLQIINAAKGFVTVEIRIPFSKIEMDFKQKHSELSDASSYSKVFSGKATHSSTPHLGENAASKLFEYLGGMDTNQIILDIDAGSRFNIVPHQAIVELGPLPEKNQNLKTALSKMNQIYETIRLIELDMKNYPDLEFTPHHSTYSIGVVRMYEDYILIGGSCRIVPLVGSDVYEKWIKMFQQSCQDIGAEFHLQDYKKPFRTKQLKMLIKLKKQEQQMVLILICIIQLKWKLIKLIKIQNPFQSNTVS